VCSGTATSCPANGFAQNGTACASDQNVCTNDICNGQGTCTHQNNTASCDDGLFCTVNDKCANGQCHGTARDCSDEVDCTVDSCNESAGQCVHTPNNQVCGDEDSCTTDICDVNTGCKHVFSCKDICRRPGWYGTRAGSLHDDENIVQEILDAVGGLHVCGQTITETSTDTSPFLDSFGLNSALEALCVHVGQDPERALYRELVTAALNCAISGAVDCDSEVSKFVSVSYNNCNALCGGAAATDDEGNSPVATCIAQLDCYNSGGHLIDGLCALGSCDVTRAPCGAEYGQCQPFPTVTFPILQVCKRFEGNCRDEDFCNPGLDICPTNFKGGSSEACKEAKHDQCTIDQCTTSD
jgi:hypothetical protein